MERFRTVEDVESAIKEFGFYRSHDDDWCIASFSNDDLGLDLTISSMHPCNEVTHFSILCDDEELSEGLRIGVAYHKWVTDKDTLKEFIDSCNELLNGGEG